MPNFAAALTPIAEALGDGWSVADNDMDNYRGILSGPDGMKVWVRTENFRVASRGRLFFSGSYDGLFDHTWQLDRTEISVTTGKTPRQVADDIRRRLLPKYREGIAIARKRKAESDADEARRDALAAEITTALGPRAENSGTGHHGHRDHAHVSLGRWSDPLYVKFEVPTGEYGVEVEIRVSQALAVKLAAALGALQEEPPKPICDCAHDSLGMVAANSGHCPAHPLPGCPNPDCGETWVEAFHGDRCDSCGWES